jgi:hypothetical protein
LTEAEAALVRSGQVDLARTGFWRAVAAVKRDRGLVEPYGERIARIDRAAFKRQVRLRVAAPIGIVLDLVGTAIGVLLVALASGAAAPGTAAPMWAITPWREIVFLAGVAAILGATHTLAHWVVGSVAGIRFTHWFSTPPLRPQPGLKVDYASYLRASPRTRAWMHASGAIVTKVVPFAAYPVALQAGLEPWASWLLLGVGVLQLITDATISTRAGDWKKFRREMRFAG